MSIDKEIQELAHNLIERHAADAGHIAAHRVTDLERQGEHSAAAIWRRVHAAVLSATLSPPSGRASDGTKREE